MKIEVKYWPDDINKNLEVKIGRALATICGYGELIQYSSTYDLVKKCRKLYFELRKEKGKEIGA